MSVNVPTDLASKYEKALLQAKMGLWEVDFSTMGVTWDEGHRLLYEVREKRYTGNLDHWYTLIHPDDRVRLKVEIENCRLDKGDLDSHYRLPLNHSSEKYIRIIAIKVRNENHEVTGLIGLNWDVTHEHKLQVDLNNSKVFLEKILDAIPDPIFIKDAEHRTVFANKEFVKLAGKEKKDLVGKLDSDFLAEKVAQVYWQQDEMVMNTEKSYQYEENVTNPEGVSKQLLTKKTSLKISDSERVLVGVIRDITEIKNIQNSLVEQSKMASLGEMAAEIAHEINNPLMIIQAKAQILQEKLATKGAPFDLKKLASDLSAIENNSIRIDKIIQSLKSVSRKSDRDPFEQVSIRKIIDEAVEISKERLNKSQISFDYSFDDIIDYDYKILARSSEIVQVLVNLFNNSFDAVKMTPQPWIKICLFLKGDRFQIEVVDSGESISAEVVSKMMQPFFTTKTAGSGTGLGLSVSKQIIKNHNGELFYDENSKHTKFIFQLKRSESISRL